jgi:hypothetical protein
MTIDDQMAALATSETYEAAWEVMRAVLLGVTTQTYTLAEYEAAWESFYDKWQNEYATRGSRSAYMRGGPRSGSNWTGD